VFTGDEEKMTLAFNIFTGISLENEAISAGINLFLGHLLFAVIAANDQDYP
jgi:hypothetical protein